MSGHRCDCGTSCPPYCGRCGCESVSKPGAWIPFAIVAVIVFWILLAKAFVRYLERHPEPS